MKIQVTIPVTVTAVYRTDKEVPDENAADLIARLRETTEKIGKEHIMSISGDAMLIDDMSENTGLDVDDVTISVN
jgi:hypothetical protein